MYSRKAIVFRLLFLKAFLSVKFFNILAFTDLFAKYFSQCDNYLDSIELIVVYEDERANDATVYRFASDTLAEIEFGNVNY